MRFENVSALIEALGPEASKMSFHWRDSKGAICNQNAVFRVNCMDCLDRTNVVQTAMGRAVLESQLVKVGLMPPYSQVSLCLFKSINKISNTETNTCPISLIAEKIELDMSS